MVLNYEKSTNTTSAYLGFESSVGVTEKQPPATPGDQLMILLSMFLKKADNPMLLPAFATGIWVEHLQHGNHRSAKALRKIQADIGLMGPYLGQSMPVLNKRLAGIVEQVDLNSLHGKIVLEHGYLTNGVSEFLADLFPSTIVALAAFNTFRVPQSQAQSAASNTQSDLDDYVEHMHIRAKAELQHRDRMLSRMNVYFQVVSFISSTTFKLTRYNPRPWRWYNSYPYTNLP